MRYLVTAICILALGRTLSGSWRKTVVLPWVLVTVPMLAGAWLANLDLVPLLITPWSDATHRIVALGTGALFAGSFTLRHVRGPLATVGKNIAWDDDMVLRVMTGVTAIAALANAAQFLIAGEIPLFSADPDHARFEVAKNGYLHVFSVLSGHLVPLIALVLVTGEQLRSGTRRRLAVLMAINMVLLTAWIARGMLIYPILTAFAVSYLLDQRSFRLKKVLAFVLILLFIVSGIKYVRDVVRFGEFHDESQKQLVDSSLSDAVIGPAISFYLTAAYNYEVLNQYADAVPSIAPYSRGRIMGGHLLSYIPGTGTPYTEQEYQNRIVKKNEEDLTLTSTLFGIPFIEFGLPGVLLASFAVGLLYRAAWTRMLRTGTPWSVFLYAFLISMVVFIPYTFLYTQVSFTWFLMTTYVLILVSSGKREGLSLFIRNHAVTFQHS